MRGKAILHMLITYFTRGEVVRGQDMRTSWTLSQHKQDSGSGSLSQSMSKILEEGHFRSLKPKVGAKVLSQR
jgi:hypothetical protein